jgi:hypothetical protein
MKNSIMVPGNRHFCPVWATKSAGLSRKYSYLATIQQEVPGMEFQMVFPRVPEKCSGVRVLVRADNRVILRVKKTYIDREYENMG